jgi:hypothetical protein
MPNIQHPHHIHAFRILLLGVLLIAVSIVKIDANALPGLTKPSVLAYATSISRGDLFAAANASRAANGMGGFGLNGQLNNSAQAKAQHMADGNYWAHVAPDGTQPWYFFQAAGYNYSRAGENLAYGFSTSSATNDGWMNSPSHRANILGDYAEVGFGIVNSPGFQGGENTIVVAHYGTQVAYTPPPPPPAPAPAPAAPAPAQAAGSSSGGSAPAPAAPAAEQPQQPTDPVPTPTQETTEKEPTHLEEEAAAPVAPIATGYIKNVSVLQTISSGAVPGVAMASLVLTMVTAFGYALSHRALMKHAFATGEHFVVSHPTFDAFALIVALTLILTTTAARLQ